MRVLSRDLADAAQGHRRGAGRDAARRRRRDGAGADRLCGRPADARTRRSGCSSKAAAARRCHPARRAPRGASAGADGVRCAALRAAPRCRAARPTMAAPRARGAAAQTRSRAARRGAAASAPALRITSFPELVALAAEKRDVMTRIALKRDVRLVRFEDGRLETRAGARPPRAALVSDLSRKLEQWTGRRWIVIVSNEPGQPTLRSQNEAQQERARTAPRRPIRWCRRCWRGSPAPRWSRCGGSPPSRPEPDAGIDDAATDAEPTTTTILRIQALRRNRIMADFLGMMKQAAQLQSKMKAMQAELDQIEVEGAVRRRPGHGAADRQGGSARRQDRPVAAEAGGDGDPRGSASSPRIADAHRKAEAAMQEKMQALTGGLPLPPGLGLG